MKRTILLAALALAALAHGDGDVRFTSIKELSKIPSQHIPSGTRFSVTGQVISVFHRYNVRTLFITDATNLIVVGDWTKKPSGRHGDIVAISGSAETDARNGLSGLAALAIDVIDNAPLPDTPPLDWNTYLLPHDDNSCFMSVSGVVTSVRHDDFDAHWNWIMLRNGAHSIPVAAIDEEYPLDTLAELVDADVVIRGMLTTLTSVFSKKYLVPFGENGMSIVRKATNPFDRPPLGTGDPSHRQTVRGIVTTVGKNWLFLQTEGQLPLRNGFIPVQLCGSCGDIAPGDIVPASGFLNLECANVQIFEAVARREGRTAPSDVNPVDIDIESLFMSQNGLREVSKTWHGKLIRVEGTVVTTLGESAVTGVMRLRKDDKTVEVQVSEIGTSGYKDAEEGSKVSATGICIVELENPNGATILPVFHRALILPRTAEDIRVIAHRPWWTPARLVAMTALLSAFLVGAMLWNKALVERARRQAGALFREMAAHKESEVKVEVRTHLAVELHDSISQSLTGIALQLDSAERANPPENTSVARFLGLARQMLGSCRRELQSCLLDLRNRTFEEKDLSEAIRRTVSPLSENAEVSVRFNVPRETLSDTAVHVILKIIRELVVNAIRHGGAKHVRIAGERDGETIRFAVRDDGTGFDPASAPGPMQGHFGLQGIRERLGDFDGTVDVWSVPGRGTKVTVAMNMTRED